MSGTSTLGPVRAEPARPRAARWLHGRTARHPLAAFLVLASGAGGSLTTTVLLMTRGVLPGGDLVARLPGAPDELAGLLLTLGALLPAALYVTWAADGSDGLRRLARRIVLWRVGLGWWLLVLAGLPVLTVLVAVAQGGSLRSVQPLPFVAAQAFHLLLNLALVNLWEEAAWSGVVQTRLEERHSLYVAALLTAVPFALVHWPLAFFDGREATVAGAAGALAGYLVLGAIFRPMLAVVLRGTGRQRPARRRPAQHVQPLEQHERDRRRPAGRRGPRARRAGGRAARHRRRRRGGPRSPPVASAAARGPQTVGVAGGEAAPVDADLVIEEGQALPQLGQPGGDLGAVRLQEGEPFRLVAAPCRDELGVAADGPDRHAGGPQPGAHGDPVEVEPVIAPPSAGGAADGGDDQAGALVVAQRVHADPGPAGGLGDAQSRLGDRGTRLGVRLRLDFEHALNSSVGS